MKPSIFKAILATSTALTLCACGGGGDGSGVMGVSSGGLIGVNAETGTNPRNAVLVQTTAMLDDQSGLSADFGGYTFNADSGFENGAAVENGNTIGLLSELDVGSPTDLILFDGAYDDGNGVAAIYYGIAGAEPTDTLPSSGSATWNGQGFADLIGTSSTTDLGTGSVTVRATFPGALSAEISGLTGPTDAISLTNMTIDGDRFEGATVTTLSSGSTVNVVGGSATGDVEGIFSGSQNDAGIPDEVGAIFTLTGDDATLIGGFVAD